MKTLLTLSAARLALLHVSISAPTFTQTGSNLRGSCLETRLASPRPIFTLTTQLIKENEDFVTVDNFLFFFFLFFFLVVVHFILELADQPLMRMSSKCWNELTKNGSLMEREKKKDVRCLPDYMIFHILISEWVIRLLLLCWEPD